MERATLGIGALLGSLEGPSDSKMGPASTLMSQMPIFPSQSRDGRALAEPVQ